MKKFISNLDLYLGSICSGLMIFILFLQVVSRYIFNNAFSWAEEVAIILFILSIYFGASAAIKTKQHLRLEIILDKVKPKTRHILDIIGNACFALFNCIVLTGLVPIVLRLKENGTETAVTGIPKWTIYGVLPVLFVVMLVRLVISSMESIKQIKAINSDPSLNIKAKYTEE